MPIHDGVLQIESFQVADCSCLDFLWKSEVSAELGYFSNIQLDQKQFLIRCQERYYLGRAWLRMIT